MSSPESCVVCGAKATGTLTATGPAGCAHCCSLASLGFFKAVIANHKAESYYAEMRFLDRCEVAAKRAGMELGV
jgi:hypothetical protein